MLKTVIDVLADEQVVAMATIKRARVINRKPSPGSLQVGAPADVAIMKLVEGQII